MIDPPILWSFRRCPYAMRARLALLSAGIRVELREILLKDKPDAFLQASASGTVPALELEDRALDESLDIMIWALERNDPQQLLNMPSNGWDLIAANDGPFKTALDHTKYATRYPNVDRATEQSKAAAFLRGLDDRLAAHPYLFSDRPTLADLAVFPFARQFAFIDKAWFDAQAWPHLAAWLDRFLDSEAFTQIMQKHPSWVAGDAPTYLNA